MALRTLRALTGAVLLASITTASSAAPPAETPPPAARVSYPLVFDRVPTAFAIETFFRTVSRAPFVLCSEVLEDRRPVTLRLPPEHVTVRTFATFLRARGYRTFVQDGLFVVCGSGASASPALDPTLTGTDVGDPAPRSVTADHLPGGPAAMPGVPADSPAAPATIAGVYQTRYRPAHELAQVVRPLLPSIRVVTTGEGIRAGDIATPPGGEIAYAGGKDDVAALLALLESLDTRPAAVEIQAVLVEVTRSKNESWGVEVVGDLLRDRLGVTVSAAHGPQQLEFRYGDVSAVLAALAGDARVDVLSAPFISAENGRRTQLVVGEEVPILGAVVSTGDGGSQQSIEYRSSGVILDVVPRVYQDALFLDLQQEVSSFARTQTGVNNSPTLTKRNLTASVEVADGAWVALGGLVSDRSEVATDRLFPRGPLIGRRDSRNQVELVLLVRAVRRPEPTA